MRNPIIREADALLPEEAAVKEAGQYTLLKEVHKKRKTLLRQVDRITSDLHKFENRRLNLSCLTEHELLNKYAGSYYFEEYFVEEA